MARKLGKKTADWAVDMAQLVRLGWRWHAWCKVVTKATAKCSFWLKVTNALVHLSIKLKLIGRFLRTDTNLKLGVRNTRFCVAQCHLPRHHKSFARSRLTQKLSILGRIDAICVYFNIMGNPTAQVVGALEQCSKRSQCH